MKKLLAFLMALVFVFSFAACSSEDKKDEKEKTTVASDQKEPSVSNEDDEAEAELKEYETLLNTALNNIDVEDILQRAGVEGEGADIVFEMLSAMKSESVASVSTVETKEDSAERVLTFTLAFPDALEAIAIFNAAEEEIINENPDLSEDEINQLLYVALAECFKDPGIDRKTVDISVDVITMNDNLQFVDEYVFVTEVCSAYLENIQEAISF